MKSLGGSVFIHNAIEFDYCLEASLTSLSAVCDETVVLDASSTDGTTDLVLELGKKLPNLRVITGIKWEQANNYARLAMLANMAKSYLKTDWHFMLQADEVLHESSFPIIKRAIKHPNYRSYFVRRLNFFGDYNHYIKIDQDSIHKPCGDRIIRLATIDNIAVGDAESIGVDPAFLSEDFLNDITIYHYGYIRKDDNHIQKTISMQSWFYGENSNPDKRVVEMEKEGIYDWRLMKTREMLEPLTKTHPKFALDYVAARQSIKTIPV